MNHLLGSAIRVSSPNGVRDVSISKLPAAHAVEWGFVLQHALVIEKYARKLCTDPRLDADDLRQEAIVWITRLHGSYDPARSAPSSWIYFMVRRARQALLVELNRREAHETTTVNFDLVPAGDNGASARQTECVALLAQVLARQEAEAEARGRAVLAEMAAIDAATRKRPVAQFSRTLSRRNRPQESSP